MTINPYTSPWLKPQIIRDQKLYWRWKSIKKNLSTRATYREQTNQLIVNDEFIIAKNSYKFRLLSHLDWAYYNPKELALAIEQDQVPVYYEQQLKDSRSDPNEWQDTSKEMELKTYYAWRKGRASEI